MHECKPPAATSRVTRSAPELARPESGPRGSRPSGAGFSATLSGVAGLPEGSDSSCLSSSPPFVPRRCERKSSLGLSALAAERASSSRRTAASPAGASAPATFVIRASPAAGALTTQRSPRTDLTSRGRWCWRRIRRAGLRSRQRLSRRVVHDEAAGDENRRAVRVIRPPLQVCRDHHERDHGRDAAQRQDPLPARPGGRLFVLSIELRGQRGERGRADERRLARRGGGIDAGPSSTNGTFGARRDAAAGPPRPLCRGDRRKRHRRACGGRFGGHRRVRARHAADGRVNRTVSALRGGRRRATGMIAPSSASISSAALCQRIAGFFSMATEIASPSESGTSSASRGRPATAS